jgi:hypothetical protein
MKRLFWIFLMAASLRAEENDTGEIDTAKLGPIMLEAAQKIEDMHGQKSAEARGLVERVQAILRTEPPDKSEAVGVEKLVREMEVFTLTFGMNPSLGGHSGVLLDRSSHAQEAYYQRLESTISSDAREVQRWLRMADAAEALKDEVKKNLCLDRARGAARALIAREPKNA